MTPKGINMKNSILNGAGPAYDTLIELQNELIDNDTQINNLLGQISTKAPINGFLSGSNGFLAQRYTGRL